ncbi:hypothetical protein AVEN_193809-1 [Araneus ventricosus]|uniref:Uncharacterized protein n=1 Tax=Araneus ventricosus TaxID=182803 RepID=A0A4Y2WTQ1_ARAVE|nr:hypothetical protein AVEN_193809-1 [Araneus ventricosus]
MPCSDRVAPLRLPCIPCRTPSACSKGSVQMTLWFGLESAPGGRRWIPSFISSSSSSTSMGPPFFRQPFYLCQKLNQISHGPAALTSFNVNPSILHPMKRKHLFAPPSNDDTHGGKTDTMMPSARCDGPSETSETLPPHKFFLQSDQSQTLSVNSPRNVLERIAIRSSYGQSIPGLLAQSVQTNVAFPQLVHQTGHVPSSVPDVGISFPFVTQYDLSQKHNRDPSL